MSTQPLGYDPRTDTVDKLSGGIKKGLISITRGVGSLFGINPFTHSGMFGMLSAKQKREARDKAGLLQGKRQGMKIPKRMTEKEAIRLGQLEASGRRPQFDGGRRGMKKIQPVKPPAKRRGNGNKKPAAAKPATQPLRKRTRNRTMY